jgi:hypothetical protein
MRGKSACGNMEGAQDVRTRKREESGRAGGFGMNAPARDALHAVLPDLDVLRVEHLSHSAEEIAQ